MKGIPIPPLPRDSDDWHKQRAQSVGASEVAMALGCSDKGGLLDLILRKRDGAAGKSPQRDNDVLADGRDMEAAILKMSWRRLVNRGAFAGHIAYMTPDCGAFRHAETPDLTATPDAVVYGVRGIHANTVLAVLETKRDRSGADWGEVERDGWSVMAPGDLRLAYWWQVQAQLAVTGAPVGFLCVMTAFDLRIIQVDPDEVAAAKVVETARNVMAWVVSGQNPPPGHADSLKAIARTITPGTETVPADPEIATAIRRYVELTATEKAAAAEKDELKRTLGMAIAAAGVKGFALEDGTRAVWQPTTGAERVDLARLRALHPEAAAACTYRDDPGGHVRTYPPKRGKGAATETE